MGFLSGLINGAIDLASTPVNIVKDIATGNEKEYTKKGIQKIGEDVEDTFDGDLF